MVTADPENRTYLVNSQAEVFRRSRKRLQKSPSPHRAITGGSSSSSQSTSDSQDARDSKDIDSKDVTDLQVTAPRSAPPTAPRNTRAARGCIAQKPTRFREEEEICMH